MIHENSQNQTGPRLINERDFTKIREAVCLQVDKIYDSCKEKDCIENAKVFFKNPDRIQKIIEKAVNIKIKKAEVVNLFTNVEEVPFKKGFYTVDIKFFIKVTLDFILQPINCNTRTITVEGIIVFDKKVILFGSEGSVKVFATKFKEFGKDRQLGCKVDQDNLPALKVEVAEPICLGAKIIEECDHHIKIDVACITLPMTECFCEDHSFDYSELEQCCDNDVRHKDHNRHVVVASVGLFSIIKLIRNVQMLMPAFDFCVPDKECVTLNVGKPCELFKKMGFPKNEFFPPQIFDFPGAAEIGKSLCCK
jgi:hypothetical protein